MSKDSLSPQEKLIQLIPEYSAGAEVGVWRGDFSKRLLQQVKPRLLHLIDPWVVYSGSTYRASKYGDRKSQDFMDSVYQYVLDRFESQIGSGQVVVHRSTSEDASMRIEDGSLDWVYIDGNHDYAYVRKDLMLYADKLRSGGLLCGDDYMSGRWWGDGVIRAVDEFVEERDLSIEIVADTQFVIRL